MTGTTTSVSDTGYRASPARPTNSVWRLGWRAVRHEPRAFTIAALGFLVFFVAPAAVGYVLGAAFRALDDGDTRTVLQLSVVLVVVEVIRMLALNIGAMWWTRSWEYLRGLMRGNLLAAQMASGGPDRGRPVRSAGEALSRFRDDTEDVCLFIDTWIDVIGGAMFTVVAFIVLASVDARATAVMLVPMLTVAVVASLLARRLRVAHRLDREATVAVTGLLGDVISSATTIKLNRAEDQVLGRLEDVMALRRRTAVRRRLHESTIRSFSSSTADIGVGLVVLVALVPLRSGRFGVGEIALFLSYGGWLGFLPRMSGMLLARRQQSAVAFEGMAALAAGAAPAATVAHRPFVFDPAAERVQTVRPGSRCRLETLEVTGLGARFDGGGVHDVSFTVERGSFTVITGPVGSGKTTLLRALLGLVWRVDTDGEVRWNGEQIVDRAAFLIPPNAAYLPQVPQLVSDSLADNVLLGHGDDGALDDALALAAVDGDVAAMATGTDTMIGPRGLRLSGGQRQRVATARAVVQRPELLVLDDLSSAVDVETELRLWDNLATPDTTLLVVSHRRVALDRADQVLTLDRGRLVDRRP